MPYIDFCRAALPEVFFNAVTNAPFDGTVALDCHAQCVACPPADGLATDHEWAVPHLVRARKTIHICRHYARETMRCREICTRQDLDVIAVLRQFHFHLTISFKDLRRSMKQYRMALSRLVMDARNDANGAFDGHFLRWEIGDADPVGAGALKAMTEGHGAPFMRGKAEVLNRCGCSIYHKRYLDIRRPIQMIRHLSTCKEAVNILSRADTQEEMLVRKRLRHPRLKGVCHPCYADPVCANTFRTIVCGKRSRLPRIQQNDLCICPFAKQVEEVLLTVINERQSD